MKELANKITYSSQEEIDFEDLEEMQSKKP